MLFKLSLKNIKKSIKDYSVYFFTLIFAVMMFYMFNSIDAQSSMLKLTDSKQDLIKALVFLINYVSVFVSVILGFLIVYSNNFLIKRRKKEIGLYFTLGMSKSKTSLILVIETIVIGFVSLLIGLGLGVVFSQFISIFVAKLFEVNMTSFKFVFSTSAFNKTLLYFGLIFILVMVFNVITLSRYKLIDLLTASKKSEKVKFRNKYVTVISFVLSCVLLYNAYRLLFDHALLEMNNKTIIMIVCGSIGTFLLFFSLSGFLAKIFKFARKIYYKDLNMFTLKQINSKINTTVISTTLICLMLLLTVGILSGALSMASVFNDSLSDNNLTDYTITSFENDYIVGKDGELSNKKLDVSEFMNLSKDERLKTYSKDNTSFVKYTYDKFTVKSLLTSNSLKQLKKEYGSNLSFEFKTPIMKESEYKKLMKVLNEEYIDIKDDEYLVLANVDMVVDAYKPFYEEEKRTITINNKELKPATNKIVVTAIENYNSAGNDGVVVISDKLVKNMEVYSRSIVGNYSKGNSEKNEKEFKKFISNNYPNIEYDIRTKIEMETASVGLKAMLIFLGLYLGITFAITSATVLAIGQLSEASDNKERYRVLRQIGAGNKMINKSLLIQIAIPFTFPLVVALIHAYFGLREINKIIVSIGSVDLTSNIVLTTLFMVIIYGGYFLITYLCGKNVIKENK